MAVRPVLVMPVALLAIACTATPAPTASSVPTPTVAPFTPAASNPTAPAGSPSARPAWGLIWPTPVSTSIDQATDDMVWWKDAYVAVGSTLGGTNSQAAAWVSDDGIAWRQTLAEGAQGETGRARQLLVTDGALVAVGWLGVEHCPPGGEGAPPCDPLPIVTWTSLDGHAWTRHDLGDAFAGARFTAVATDGHEMKAVGSDATGAPSIWRSVDGVEWTPEATGPEFTQASLAAIAWSESTWLVGGSVGPAQPQSGGIISQPNTRAAIWRADSSGSWLKADFGRAAWNVADFSVASDGIVATAQAGDTKNGTYWWSADGNDWAPAPGIPFPVAADGQSIVGDAYATGDWIAYSISSDGQQWQGLPDQGELATRPRWGVRPEADLAFLIRDKLFVTSSDSLLWPAQITHP